MILWSEALCISAIPQASNCQNRTVWQSGACQAPCRHLLCNRKNRFPEQSVHTTDFSRQGIALITFSQVLVDSVGFQAHLPASPRRDWILNGKKKKIYVVLNASPASSVRCKTLLRGSSDVWRDPAGNHSILPLLESQLNTRNTLNNRAATWHHISLPFV